MDKKTWPTHMLPTRDPPQDKRHTDWKWRAGNKFSKLMDRKKSRDSHTHIRQNRLQQRAIKRDPEVHNTQAKDPWWRRKHCKYIFTQHRSTQIHKENFGGLQERYWQQQLILGDFNTPLSKMGRSSNQNISKDTAELNNTLDQMDLTDIYRIFHFKEAKYSFLPNA